MNIHKNARLTPKDRAILVRRIVEEGLRVEEAAQASGVSVHSLTKLLPERMRSTDRTKLAGSGTRGKSDFRVSE